MDRTRTSSSSWMCPPAKTKPLLPWKGRGVHERLDKLSLQNGYFKSLYPRFRMQAS